MKYIPEIKQSQVPVEFDANGSKDISYQLEPNWKYYNLMIPIQVDEFININTNYIPTPTDEYYTNGYFIRFFLIKTKEKRIYEVNSEMYNAPNLKLDS